MHSEYAHQQRQVSATLFRFHIECYVYTGYIKLFVVLGILTDLCLIGYGFIQKMLSGKQRVWIQIRPTFDTSRHRAKGICFQNGLCCLVCMLSHARIQKFSSAGSPTDTKKVTFILLYPQLLILQRGPNGLFKEIYKLICFYAAEGGPKFSEGPIVNSYGNL